MNKETQAFLTTVLFDAIKRTRALEVKGKADSKDEFVQGANFGGRMFKSDVIDLLYDILDEVNGKTVKHG